jgi:hypothetical protein
MNVDAAFGTLADADLWEEAAAVTAGFLLPTVAHNLINGMTDYDVPDEAYGALVIAGSSYSPMYSGEMALGGGVYVADKLLERFDLKQSIQNAGA